MTFKVLMNILSLLDVSVIAINGEMYVIIVEASDIPAQSLSHQHCIWHIWKSQPACDEWHKIAEKRVTLPKGNLLRCAGVDGKLYSIIQSNDTHGLYITPWNSDCATFAPEAPGETVALNLDADVYSCVTIEPRSMWSTMGPPQLLAPQWIFNPILANGAHPGSALLVVNTADARAVVYEFTSSSGKLQRTVMSENCFEPSIVACGSTSLLVGRKTASDWSVFYNFGKYRMQEILLPLELVIINERTASADTITLSDGHITGPSYVFAMSALPGQGTMLATVTGMSTRPFLHLLTSMDGAKNWHMAAEETVPSIPRRLSCAGDTNHYVVAAAFGSDISVAVIPR